MKPKAWNLEYEILNMESQIWNLKYKKQIETWHLEYEFWNMNSEISNMKYEIWNMKSQRRENQKYQTRRRRPGLWNQEYKTRRNIGPNTHLVGVTLGYYFLKWLGILLRFLEVSWDVKSYWFWGSGTRPKIPKSKKWGVRGFSHKQIEKV